jgi:Mn-containing catalase
VDHSVKIYPSVSSAERVKSVDRRRRNSQQNSFKEALKERQKKKKKKKDQERQKKKKKKKDQISRKISGDSDASERKKPTIHAGRQRVDNGGRSAGVLPIKIIDIRV